MILAFSPTFGLATATAAVLLYGLLALASKRLPAAAASAVLLAACFFQALTLAEGLLGDPPRFGFAPALSMTVWMVVLVYAIESKLIPELRARWALSALGAAVVLLSMVFPGSSYTQIASPWLPLHWALGIASYGLFGAALLHGWLISLAEHSMRSAIAADTGVPLLKLERLTFRFVEAGFILLTASLLAGWLFAETLYGSHLKSIWNHKTIFSVLAWLSFAGLLVGRARLGWRGRTARKVLYLGSGLLLLGYAGSRFVIEVVLQRA
jgi:ABC-type uncharacterized transport system permease subunit